MKKINNCSVTYFLQDHAHHLGMNYYVNFLGRLGSNGFQKKNEDLAPMAIEKIKIPGAILEQPARQHCHSSPFTKKMG
jgi:hypothetical protein